MDALAPLRPLFAYGDAMNDALLDAAGSLAAPQLDQPFDMGLGTLRKTLSHIYVGEAVWLERWKGNGEQPWPPYETHQTPGALEALFAALRPTRDAFLATLSPAQLAAEQTYRDSKGSRFVASLHEMILQGLVHSTHHRAQATNMIRRLTGAGVELDFMYWRRRPAP